MKRTLIFIVGVCLLALSFLNAADGTWDTTTATVTENWSDTAFWSGGTVASGVNATATFEYFTAGGSGSAFDSIISLDSAFTLGSIVANGSGSGNTHNITIVGPGVLTLETGTATSPTITNNLSHGRSVTINAVIDGTEGLDLSSGPIVLGGANTYTGLTQINNNVVTVNHNQALGSTTGATSVTSSLAAIMLNNGITVTGETLNLTGIGTASNLGALCCVRRYVASAHSIPILRGLQPEVRYITPRESAVRYAIRAGCFHCATSIGESLLGGGTFAKAARLRSMLTSRY